MGRDHCTPSSSNPCSKQMQIGQLFFFLSSWCKVIESSMQTPIISGLIFLKILKCQRLTEVIFPCFSINTLTYVSCVNVLHYLISISLFREGRHRQTIKLFDCLSKCHFMVFSSCWATD